MKSANVDDGELPHAMIGLLFFVAIVLAVASAAWWRVDPTGDVIATLVAVPVVIHVLHRWADRLRARAVANA